MTRAYNTATTQQNSGGAVAGVTAGKNAVINGAFDNWQRGTSFTALGNVYTADRWNVYNTNGAGGYTVTRQTSWLDGFNYALRMQRNSGATGTSGSYLSMAFEGAEFVRFTGGKVTLSFYARKGADYSPTSSNWNVFLEIGTNADGALYTGLTGGINPISQDVVLTTGGARYSFTFDVPTGYRACRLQMSMTGVGTAGTNDWMEITGVQLEVGSVATPFSRAGGTIQGELAACQRYYQKSYNQATNPGTATAASSIGMAAVSTGANANIIPARFPVVMRTSPTVTIYSPNTGTSGKIGNMSASSDVNATDLESGSSGFNIYVTGAPGGAVGYWLAAQYQAVAEL